VRVARVKRAEIGEAAVLLRRLLELVESGDLDASSAHARAMVRRIEGAAAAFEIIGG
jgi:hypothetical protein